MEKEVFDYLFDVATDLAVMHFDDPTDEHIEVIFDRLVINHQWGIGSEGSVTVH